MYAETCDIPGQPGDSGTGVQQGERRDDTGTLKAGKRFLVSSISSDSHTWNLVYLQMLIQEHGHEVVNLGACVPHEELVDACLRHRPDVLVLSSVNGHGHIEGDEIIHKIRSRPELAEMTTVIGGKLGVRGAGNSEFVPALRAAGFDAVYGPRDGIRHFTRLLTGSGEAPRPQVAEMAA